MVIRAVFRSNKVISDHDFAKITLGDCAQLDLLDRHRFSRHPVECTYSMKTAQPAPYRTQAQKRTKDLREGALPERIAELL